MNNLIVTKKSMSLTNEWVRMIKMKKETAHIIEIVIILAILFATYLVSAEYDILEKMFVFIQEHEKWEIDELITVSFVFIICLMVFSARLYSEEIKTSRLLKKQNEERGKALAEIKSLRGIIPICSICKRIRDEEGAWQQMEAYVQKRSFAEFSHGICEKCLIEHYGLDMEKD